MKKQNIEVEGGEILIQSKEGHYAVIPAKHRQEVIDMVKDGCDDCINNYIQTLPKDNDYAEDGTLLPDVPPTIKDMERARYMSVAPIGKAKTMDEIATESMEKSKNPRSTTYVEPKISSVSKQTIVQPALKTNPEQEAKDRASKEEDNRTPQQKKMDEEYQERINNPTARDFIGDVLQYPLRAIANPLGVIGDFVDIGTSINQEQIEYNKYMADPYRTDKEKSDMRFNTATRLTRDALLNTVPIEAATGNMVKSGKNLVKSSVSKVDDVGKSLMKPSSFEDIATQLKNNFSTPDADIINLENIKNKYRYDNKDISKELRNLLNLDSIKNNLKQQNSGNLKNHLKFIAKDGGLDMSVYNKLIDDLDVNKLAFHTKEKLKLSLDKAASYADEYFAHMDSPKMQKKLKDFSDEYGIDLVEEYKKHKVVFNKNKNTMIRFDYNSPINEMGSYGVDFELAMGKNSKLPMYESNRINLNPSLVNNEEELQKTIWHELSHSFNRKIKNNPKILKELDDIFYTDISSIPKEKINKTWIEDFQAAKLDNLANEQVTYLNKPEEIWSHLSTNLKQDLKKEGLIKDFNEPITLEHLDKIQSSTINDYLPLIKDKPKFLKLINKMTLSIAPAAIGAGAAVLNNNNKTE